MTAQLDQYAEQVRHSVDSDRLLHVATSLVSVPSPTLSASGAADRLASILLDFEFDVERPQADWPEAPAVVVRYGASKPGRTMQFDGHLDTVHLPFVPPEFKEGILSGSGAADMKGGIAAAVEALLVLRELDAIQTGGILLTAHDHHEGPWGDRRQIRWLLQNGIHGDAVLLPEYLADRLPIAGRGSVIFHLKITRDGTPTHEISLPPNTPNVVVAATELVSGLYSLNKEIEEISSAIAGHDSVFIGSVHTGEMYNQSPVSATIDGVRRWVTPGDAALAVDQLNALCELVAERTQTDIEVELDVCGDAFALEVDDPFVKAFQTSCATVCGNRLPIGDKPFVDDGNQFALFGIPAITHGPAALGAHTTNESVQLSELERVAQVYALTAIQFCNSQLLLADH